MSGNCHMVLDGDWSKDNAADLLKLLTGRLGGVLQAEPRPQTAEIDFAGIGAFDACGCQLLAVFLEHLRRHGITPAPCNIPEELSGKISLLGFSHVFRTAEQADLEAA